MENNEGSVRIAPGEPGYEEAQQDLVTSCPDNRPFTMSEALAAIDADIELFEREKVNFDFTMDGGDGTYEPAGDFIARQKKLKIEFEQAITKAEAEEPGSTEPPIPTEEEKEFYEVKEEKE